VLALVGGFLGAGKTTLILRAARVLQGRGLRAAVITNDQDSALVDTMQAEAHELRTREVAGGCFCCRFSDLMDAADGLRAYSPDVIFAEPVGSCVDLAATILQPLQAAWLDRYRLAPLTVLVDPEMARRVYREEAGADIGFLFRNQVAEADLLCVTKSDRYAGEAGLPFPADYRLSAVTGEGVEQWLGEVFDSKRVVGAHLLDVDYGRYAEAEAALAWLNLDARIRMSDALSPAAVAGSLLDELDRALTEAGMAIAHLKVFDRAPTGFVKAAICANGDEPAPEGDLIASPAGRHELVVNLRALGEPERLKSIVAESLGRIPGRVDVRHLRAFRPPPPVPEHRVTKRSDSPTQG
jgi:hypothetical protein